jgi:hypothetical protein
MIEQQEHIPWWQRELNARLARRALRRQALRRMALQILGVAGLTAIGVLMLMALAQDARGRLAHSMRRSQKVSMAANVHTSSTDTRAGHLTTTVPGKQPAPITVQMGQEPRVATTEITGRFYTSDGRCTYDTPSTQLPLFVAQFPTINFAGRPFTDYGASAGQPNIVAAHASDQVGLGSLNHFNAILTGSLVVHHPGDVPFTFLVDDAFNLGVGARASRVRGTLSNPPASGVTALRHLPVIGSFNQGHLQATTAVTVHFPRAGSYPYELDYAECMAGGEIIKIMIGGQVLSATNQATVERHHAQPPE